MIVMNQEQNNLLKLVRDNILSYSCVLGFSGRSLNNEEYQEYRQKLEILHKAKEDLQLGKSISQKALDILKNE